MHELDDVWCEVQLYVVDNAVQTVPLPSSIQAVVAQNASGAGQIANPLGHPAPLAHIFQHSSPLAKAVICGLAHTAHIASISPIAQSSRSTAAVVSAALCSAATMENPNSIPPASPLSNVTIPPRAQPPSLSSVAVAVPAPMSSTVAAAAAAATAHREAIRREGRGEEEAITG